MIGQMGWSLATFYFSFRAHSATVVSLVVGGCRHLRLRLSCSEFFLKNYITHTKSPPSSNCPPHFPVTLRTTMVIYRPQTFIDQGRIITGHERRLGFVQNKTEERLFIAYFGTTALVCSHVWSLIFPDISHHRRVSPTHLLWTLMFMKIYASTDVMSGIARCNPTTFQKWVWRILPALADASYQKVLTSYELAWCIAYCCPHLFV